MIGFFNWRSIWIGTDMKRFNELRDYLDKNEVRYKYKVKNRTTEWSGRGGTVRGRAGSIGNPTELMYEYELFVHKKDYERVRL